MSLPGLDRNHIDPVSTLGAEDSKRSPNTDHKQNAKQSLTLKLST